MISFLPDTYRRIAKVDLKFPPSLSGEVKDLISKVRSFLSGFVGVGSLNQ